MANDKLQEAISAYRIGKKDSARQILSQLVLADPKDEIAWLWLSVCLDDIEQKRYCVAQVLRLNPNNQSAREALAQLDSKTTEPTINEITSSISSFVTLACPTCDGKLKITEDMERFACTYCGNEHIVRRSGGAVSLAPVIEILKRVESGTEKAVSELSGIRSDVNRTASGLSKVQNGVDRTAAELTIARLRNEIALLEIQKRRVVSSASSKDAQLPSPSCFLGVCFLLGGGALVVGLSYGWFPATCFGGILLAIGFLLLPIATFMIAPIDKQIAQKKQELDKLLKSVSV